MSSEFPIIYVIYAHGLTRAGSIMKSTCPCFFTILVSPGVEDVKNTGYTGEMQNCVMNLSALKKNAELDDVVCAPHDLEILRSFPGQDFILTVPGLRPPGKDAHDQIRAMTHAESVQKDIDYRAIDRPITKPDSHVEVVLSVLSSIGS